MRKWSFKHKKTLNLAKMGYFGIFDNFGNFGVPQLPAMSERAVFCGVSVQYR